MCPPIGSGVGIRLNQARSGRNRNVYRNSLAFFALTPEGRPHPIRDPEE